MTLLSPPDGGCQHPEILAYDDGRYAECTTCGAKGFPLTDDPCDDPDPRDALIADLRAKLAGRVGGTQHEAVRAAPPVRLIEIRQRLDRAVVEGFGFWPREDLIDDIRWLLDEHKRLRRGVR